MRAWGFPGGAVVENLPANAGDMASSPGLGGSHVPRSSWARVWGTGCILCLFGSGQGGMKGGPATVLRPNKDVGLVFRRAQLEKQS